MKQYQNNDWLSSVASNENGYARGSWNGKTNKWEATVNPTNGPADFFTSISHRKVSEWLETKQLQYGIR